VPLDDFLVPLAHLACRHIPDGSPHYVLDFRFATQSVENRWNRPGEPTLYLASDYRTLLAEYGRHFPDNRPPTVGRVSLARRIYDVPVDLQHVLDLRDLQLCSALDIDEPPHRFLADREFCRTISTRLRAESAAQALIVPSMALLDQSDRWVLVVFVGPARQAGLFRFDALEG
jgi:RES domain-containing protein